jgi:hypothetical protein
MSGNKDRGKKALQENPKPKKKPTFADVDVAELLHRQSQPFSTRVFQAIQIRLLYYFLVIVFLILCNNI